MSTVLRTRASDKSSDNMSPERTEARIRTLGEACHHEHGQSESSYLAGAYRVEYERLYHEHRAVLAELARVKGVLARVEDAHFPDELPDGASYAFGHPA